MAYVADYVKDSINEGEGLRNVLYISGCLHKCPSCFSPETHDFKYGLRFTQAIQQKIIQDASNNMCSGITVCGGDSFFSAEDMIPFIQRFRQANPDKTVWAYTGFTFEQILAGAVPYGIEYLSLLDVLIDGMFVAECKDLTLKYRGSSNQRIIDVQASLSSGQVVEYNGR